MDASSVEKFGKQPPASSDSSKAQVIGEGAPASQATDRAAAVASSSNALEMSRMLMTPIRL